MQCREALRLFGKRIPETLAGKWSKRSVDEESVKVQISSWKVNKGGGKQKSIMGDPIINSRGCEDIWIWVSR